jgi:hypothetical protein
VSGMYVCMYSNFDFFSSEELDSPSVSALWRGIEKLRNVGQSLGEQKFIISSSSVLRKAR